MTRSQLPSPAGPAPSIFSGGFQALAFVAKRLGVQANAGQITHRMGIGRRSPNAEDLLRAAKIIGIRARLVRNPSERKVRSCPTPAMMKMKDGSWVAYLGQISADLFRLTDPITRETVEIPFAELMRRLDDEILLVAKSWSHATEDLTFGVSWFLPVMKKYRRPIIEMMIVSFFINILALGYPLSFQLLMDKVLPHKSFSTLIVVISAMMLLAFFSAILSHIRQYLLQHTANRIDVELGAKLYSHLLHLPISYFESRAAGVIVSRARELRSIRSFLTGRALLSAIDLLFIFIYLGVLFIYSKTLTWIVIASLPCYVVIGAMMRPALRRLLKAKFRAWSGGQKLMVESIVGIQTVKAAAIEPLLSRKWEEKIAAYAKTSFDASMLGVTVSTATGLVSKFTTAAILFFGVLAVLGGNMTVGGLIAFNLISRLVAKPILRISQLYQSFQEVQVSIEHVSDIFNAEVERTERAAVVGPQLQGQIALRNVVFHYKPDLPPALNDVSLLIQPGEVVGIVGPSGSGKSTLTKLLQKFHAPTGGDILVDGIDITQIDAPWLRRQLGVVLQENFLFNQTVHENIAMARPQMPRAQVIRVARLAGADEFITQLAQGYDTKIEERGANLSGGQRQRLAIARALATNPRILIFDEATSALDYESERIIQNNMNRIVQDRTVIIIAHRLAAVRYCDRIVGMMNGEIVEVGTHEQLLRRRNGLYAHLWALQNDHVSL